MLLKAKVALPPAFPSADVFIGAEGTSIAPGHLGCFQSLFPHKPRFIVSHCRISEGTQGRKSRSAREAWGIAVLPIPPSEVALPGLSRAPSSFYNLNMDQEILMECDRCQGLMLKDYFVAMVVPSQQAWLCAWRCLDCGSKIDPLTLTTPHRVVEHGISFGTDTATDIA